MKGLNLPLRKPLAKAIKGAAKLCIGLAILSCSGDGPSGPITIDPPTSVTAVLISPTSAQVSWAASADAEKVSSYNIVRNGTKIGEVSGMSYTDNSLVELTTYSYAISANGPSGITSPLSATSATATITAPDVTPPKVIAITPAAGATGVLSAAMIAVTFNERIDASSLSVASFAVSAGGAMVPGSRVYSQSNNTAEFKPAGFFPSGGVVSVVVYGVRDVAGNAMSVAFESWFTAFDSTPPTVVSSSPPPGATNVAVTAPVLVTFSEAMAPSTINSTSLMLTAPGGSAIPGTIGYDATNNRATLIPVAPLQNSTTYTINATSGITDVAGNALVAFTSTFTTAALADIAPPSVLSIAPANGATGVAVGVQPAIAFSRAMDPATLTSSTITLALSGGAAVPASVSYNATTNVVTLTPTTPLAPSAQYTITVTTGVRGSNNVPLGAAVTSSFTTAQAPDTTLPTVVATSPADGATNVNINTPLTVTFSEAMAPASITTSTVLLRATSTGQNVPGTVVYNADTKTATFAPLNPLAYLTGYTFIISGGLDLAGNSVAPTERVFTTMAPPDVAPPGVSSVFPNDGDLNVPVNASVSVTFNRSMNPSSINTATITLAPNGGSPVPATVTFNSATNTATLSPSNALDNSTIYRVTVTPGVQGSNNVALPAPVTATFTTIAAGPGLPLVTIVLNFCPANVPIFFAYKNDGAAWARVLPDGSGSFTFMATPKVAITFVNGILVDTYYTTSDELKSVSHSGCRESGTKTLSGSVANVGTPAPSGDPAFGVVAAGGRRAGGTGAFTLTSVPDGSLDLFALAYSFAGERFTPAKAIIRRNLLPQSGSTIPVFDFSSTEALPTTVNQLSVTGGLSSDFNYLFMDFRTANGSHQDWEHGIAYQGATRAFRAIPSGLLAEGDLHTLMFWGRANDFLSHRSAKLFFRQPSDKTIVLGSNLNRPTFTTIATSPSLRIRGTLPSQAEYGSAVRFYYRQLSSGWPEGERDWNVTGTAGYFGGTAPSSWELDMPDLSAVPGFPAFFLFEPSQPTSADAEAWSSLFSLFVGPAPRDGDVMKYAGWTAPEIPGRP